jgi:putative endonuclease
MTARHPITRAWRSLVRRASSKLIERQELSPEARLGRNGEEAAYWHLRDQGFTMVEKNYRPAGLRGEIDMIGWDGDVLVFVEVKTRQSTGIMSPEAAVDRNKQRNMIAAAQQYRRKANLTARPYRFDVLSVTAERDGAARASSKLKLEHFRDAFRDKSAAGA